MNDLWKIFTQNIFCEWFKKTLKYGYFKVHTLLSDVKGSIDCTALSFALQCKGLCDGTNVGVLTTRVWILEKARAGRCVLTAVLGWAEDCVSLWQAHCILSPLLFSAAATVHAFNSPGSPGRNSKVLAVRGNLCGPFDIGTTIRWHL